MGSFRYETHLHTKEASACAMVSGYEQARRYKEAGYTGIVVTDHFFNGNTCIPSDLSWERRVDQFRLGFENAREEGERIGLSVFFGWEAKYGSQEFLIYGLDIPWLKKHPEIMSWTVEEQYRRVREAGGLVVHAHPFRERDYIKEIRLFPDAVDAVEVINIGNDKKEFDEKAKEYAEQHKLLMTAGTDSHGYEKRRSGVSFDHKLTDIDDFIRSIKSGKYKLIQD
ncbi:MAG: histidinol-phosphatase [Clostridiales bacterium]|nr:histidinol-phosphatase [Clostridiales bacterium]